MPKPIIEVENLSKLYRLGLIGSTTFRESVERWWCNIKGKGEACEKIGHRKIMISKDDPQAGPEPNTIWALKDVTFSVQQGEILGIIGRNGAGKSALLKILSRITEPTSGHAIIRGRTSSLLEIGTGFHLELTGRENIYLNGAILGMSKSEIENKFDDIVVFSEMEKFIDTPVKRYSHGMYVRLAFAVAAHLEPEILFVDEVLAVGDIAFQKKCIGKMGEAAERGRTILFVSHNMSTIVRLCSRAILLNRGQLVSIGEPKSVISSYLTSTGTLIDKCSWEDLSSAPGDEFIRLLSIFTLSEDYSQASSLYQDRSFIIRIIYQVLRPMMNPNVGFQVKSVDGVVVFSSYDSDNPEWSAGSRSPGKYISDCLIPANLFNQGVYYLTAEAGIPFHQLCFYVEDLICLDINGPIDGGGPVARNSIIRKGIILPDLKWQTRIES